MHLKWLAGVAGLLMASIPLAGQDVPGRLLIGVRDGVSEDAVAQTLKRHGAVARKNGSIAVAEESSAAVMESLRVTGLFAYVERDHYARLGATPNDPSFASQWHLTRIASPAAWDETTGSPAVTVAVIDTGVDGKHSDLKANVMPGWNFVAGTNDTTDRIGHGTAVAGTIAAAGNNGLGVAGVTWHSRILPLVVVDENDLATYSDIADAIRYAADQGARVINISVGGPAQSAALQSAVDYAYRKGSLIFAAMMNDGMATPYYPAACNHVMAVSATDAYDHLASFSNYGAWVTIAAPGYGILTTAVGGGYAFCYGTSFASPIAAGVAALVWSVNAELTAAEVAAILEKSADDLGSKGFDTSFGWGRVNAGNAVSMARPAVDSVVDAPAVITRSHETLHGQRPE
jgi:thermitase